MFGCDFINHLHLKIMLIFNWKRVIGTPTVAQYLYSDLVWRLHRVQMPQAHSFLAKENVCNFLG